MKHIYELIEDTTPEEDLMFEMSNLLPKNTGLKYKVWIQTKLPGNTGKHNAPRIKIEDEDKNLIPISIDKETPKVLSSLYKANKISAKDFKHIVDWIKANHKILIQYWNGEIDIVDFVQNIKKV